ncbi:DUF4150 domain-containing protein [Mesorhizobium sp. A623]
MTVYANGLEVSCKAQSDRVIAAFPDVCFTPPENPATPPGVPVPYPTFGFDTDTDKGTGTVKIGGQTINQKNKSYYTKTTGTEAGCAAKKGIINSKNTGKKYNRAWSSNVKADKEPVCRFSDITTNNHACEPPNAPTTQPQVGGAGTGGQANTKCLVGEYSKIKEECNSRSPTGETHHIVPDMVYRQTTRATTNTSNRVRGAPSLNQGMCICLTPGQHKGLHSGVNQSLAALPPGPGGPAGTSLVGACAAVGVIGLRQLNNPALTPDCMKEASDKVAQQTAPIATQAGRTTLRPPAPNTPAFNALRP